MSVDDAISNFFRKIGTKASDTWTSIKTTFIEAKNSVFDGFVDMHLKIVGVFESIWTSIKDSWNKGKMVLSEVMKSILRFMIKPFIDLLDNKVVAGVLTKSMNEAVASMKKTLDINSPSGVTEDMAMHLVGGFDKGMSRLPASMSRTAQLSMDYITEHSTAIRDKIVQLNQDVAKSTSELSRRENITIKPIMDSLRDGIGSKGKYTIDHKSTPINVNLDVRMNADTVEHVLVNRPNSKIATVR